MSYYYKYNFVSPDPIFAKVKEELRSYFSTGMIDDLMFPIWTDSCLKKLGRSVYTIQNGVLLINDFTAILPPDFYAVREAWMCTDLAPQEVRLPGVTYCQVRTLLNPAEDPCDNCNPCAPQYEELIYKTTTDVTFTNRKSFLLKPGNISVRDNCTVDCINFGSTATDTFDIRGGKFITNFREGDVYMLYYSLERDEEGNQMIPDSHEIQQYIESYIKYKIFEQLWHQVTDESSNQIQTKFQYYKSKSEEDHSVADVYLKKETIDQKRQALNRNSRRMSYYEIQPQYKWRR